MTATDNRIGIAGTLLAAIVFGEVVALGVDGPFLATMRRRWNWSAAC
ncbi:Uncharacterised protein [Sphingomonas paucimobilis]|nr:Uncharacterised protein [Sphingomonas paucimobilis]